VYAVVLQLILLCGGAAAEYIMYVALLLNILNAQFKAILCMQQLHGMHCVRSTCDCGTQCFVQVNIYDVFTLLQRIHIVCTVL
jgi:hypothetical protein